MVRTALKLSLAFAAALVVIAYGLHLNPAALDWRRARIPTLPQSPPPAPAAVGFAADLKRTWTEPETFSFYRGAETRDGIERRTRLTPPLQIAWTTDSFNIGVHGASKGSPAVDASGIYVGSDSGHIRAYAHDGTLRWSFKTFGAVRGIHSTPILSTHRVYVGSYGGTFYVLDKTNGEVLWTFHLDQTAFGSSPLIVDDTLVAAIETETLNAFVVRLDPRDGRVLWRSPYLGEQIHSSPAYDRATNTILIGANNKILFALNADDGRITWQRFVGGEIKGTPLLHDGVVYVSSWAQKLHALDIKTGQPRWEAPLTGASQSSPTLIPDSDVLVVGDAKGALHGVDRRTGRRRWLIPGEGAVMSSALAVQTGRDNVKSGPWLAWIGCGTDGLCAVDARAGRVVQRVPLAGQLTGVPVAFDGALYLSLNFPGGLVKLQVPPSVKVPPSGAH